MNIKLNKWWTLVGLSLLPSVLGFIINFLVIQFPVNGFMMFVMSFLFYAYWLYAGYKIKKAYDMNVFTIGLAHSVGLLSLAYLGYQVIYVGAFHTNALGLAPQLYFIPGLSLVSRFDSLSILNDLMKLCTATLTLMVITFYLGGRLYIERIKRY